jgi:hypothetical protein
MNENKTSVSLFSRLNLRHNWPLWLTIFVFLGAIIYLLAFFLSPLLYPYESFVVYPLLIFYHNSLPIFALITLVSFLTAVVWACLATTGGNLYGLHFI